MLEDELAHFRIGHLAPAAAGEDAVVAGALDDVVLAALCRNAAAQAVRGLGLAGAGNVVELALDRQQRGGADVLRPHRLAVDHPGAVDQREVLEDGADRLEVVVGVHVEHRVVLVIELAVRLGAVVVAAHQVQEIVPVRVGVAVRVHRDEAGVLHEARVDAPAGAGEVLRHAVDHVVLEPLDVAVHRQVVDRGRALSGVDRAAHHRHRARGGLAARGHQRDRRQHRHGGLADRDHVDLGAEQADEVLHIGDVVGQVEAAGLHRHHAGVDPVGDVDLVVLQQRAYRVAQQRRVVARQRRHHQHDRLRTHALEHLRVVGVALEAQQAAEGAVLDHLFLDGHVDAVDLDRGDAEGRLLVFLGQTVKQVEAGGHALGAGGLGKR